LTLGSGRNILIFVKLKPGVVPETIDRIGRVYRRFNSGDPITIGFLDSGFNVLYRSEILMGTLLTVFGAAAGAIVAISLFGLASYSAEHSVKEIGVRRIFGASVAGLVVRLSRDLTSFVFLANLAAGPAAYLLMAAWLENYALRVE
jgi:putative ABC transport system permease protein